MLQFSCLIDTLLAYFMKYLQSDYIFMQLKYINFLCMF